MVYVLITIGVFFSIITTAILKSITKDSKFKIMKRALVVFISVAVYVVCCVILLQQKNLD